MDRAGLILLHLGSLLAAIAWLRFTGDNPRVLVFAFMLGHVAQLLTIAGLLRLRASAAGERLLPLLERLRRGPAPGEVPQPIRSNGTPAELGGYLLVLSVLGGMTGLLLHIDEHKQLAFEGERFARELGWASLLAGMYWVESLASRGLTIDFAATPATNYGYNAASTAILGFSVLITAGLLAFAQAHRTPPSPWIALGPLLAVKCVFDLARDLGRSS